MKTTIEIDDELLRRAKIRAAQQGTSLRSVFEDALRRALDEHQRRASSYTMPDRRVHGSGLRPEVRDRTLTDLIHSTYVERQL
ncbi:MAG: DUF2191 domain-containing protein [Pseudonocardiaceae bacterium]